MPQSARRDRHLGPLTMHNDEANSFFATMLPTPPHRRGPTSARATTTPNALPGRRTERERAPQQRRVQLPLTQQTWPAWLQLESRNLNPPSSKGVPAQGRRERRPPPT